MAGKMITSLIKKFFNKQKPHLRFYSLYPGVADVYPIFQASKLPRNFTKNQPPPQVERLEANVAKCPGIRKVAMTGWVVPAPADFIIRTNGDGVSFEWREPIKFDKEMPGTESYIMMHTESQTVPVLDDVENTLRTTVKVETPWRVDASDDIVLLQLPLTYANEPRFTAAHGILDPMQSHVINLQLFWNVLEGETLIRAGTPLAQYIPIKRSELNYSAYDHSVASQPTEVDIQREKAYNYAANCSLLDKDTLASRLKRAKAVLTKYKHKG